MKLCECGCGRPTLLARRTVPQRGAVQGQPNRFIQGHTGGRQFKSLSERFWSKVAKGEGCWEWQAFKDRKGYGRFGLAYAHFVLAHRFAYEDLVGPIPAGLELDHLCRNPGCVRPSHLEPVTHAENMRRTSPYPPPSPKNCEYCGSEFLKKRPQGQRRGRFCDRSCMAKWRESRKRKVAA